MEAGITWGSLDTTAQDRVKWKQFNGEYAPHPERQRIKSSSFFPEYSSISVNVEDSDPVVR